MQLRLLMSVRRRLFRTKKSMESLYLGKPVDKDFESEVYQSTGAWFLVVCLTSI